MSKRKPLSAEEKRMKLLELLHETNEVFQLKELEKLAPKEKGIVQQSVKSVLQELVDAGLVRSEKISGHILYWAFRRDSITSIKNQLQKSETLGSSLATKIQAARAQITAAESAQLSVEQVEALQREIEILKKEKTELQRKLATYANKIDYATIKTMQKDSKNIMVATNRWTDNIFCVKTWCMQKFAKEGSELNKAFGIPEDLDYFDS